MILLSHLKLMKHRIKEKQTSSCHESVQRVFRTQFIIALQKNEHLPGPCLKKALVQDHQSPFEATYHEKLYLKTGLHVLVFDKVY